eukprot:scaffold1883_cov396-Prasinococcus_capsulatus_cf.AAC.24
MEFSLSGRHGHWLRARGPHLRAWCAVCNSGALARLRHLLPPTFEDLEVPFGVGVVDSRGHYRVVTSGCLPEAVVASASVQLLFQPQDIPGLTGGPFGDGGLYDRLALSPW